MNYQWNHALNPMNNQMNIQNQINYQRDEEDEKIDLTNQMNLGNEKSTFLRPNGDLKNIQDILNFLISCQNPEKEEMGISKMTQAIYQDDLQQLVSPPLDQQLQPDQSGSIPIFYAAILKRYGMFFYLWKHLPRHTIYYNAEGKSILHYIINNDDVFLFRLLMDFDITLSTNLKGQDIISYIFEKDAVECYKHFKYKYYAFQQVAVQDYEAKNIRKFENSISLRNRFNYILSLHAKDSNPQITVFYLLCTGIGVLYFAFTPVYQESSQNFMIVNFGLLMLCFYWLFNQIWFINQSYTVGSVSQGNYIVPQDSSLIQNFRQYTEDVNVNWYTHKYQVISDDHLRNCYKMNNKMTDNESIDIDDINLQSLDALDLIDYMFQNNLLEDVKRLDYSRLCTTCRCFKDYGTKHCSLCNQCIRHQSHHSVFYNRCINENNHLPYVIIQALQFFLILLYLLRIIIFYLSSSKIQDIFQILLEKEGYVGIVYYLFLTYCMFNTGYHFYFHIKGVCFNLTYNEVRNRQRYPYINQDRVPAGYVHNIVNYIVHSLLSAKLK